MNYVVEMGRLTAAPVLKTTNSGISVLSFTLAVPRSYQQKDGEKITDFIDCVAWRSDAEFISKYFGKGDPIAILGEIQTRIYEGNDGNKRKAVEVVVKKAHFCGSKSNATQSSGQQSNAGQNNNNNFDYMAGFADMPTPADDDLPF